MNIDDVYLMKFFIFDSGMKSNNNNQRLSKKKKEKSFSDESPRRGIEINGLNGKTFSSIKCMREKEVKNVESEKYALFIRSGEMQDHNEKGSLYEG